MTSKWKAQCGIVTLVVLGTLSPAWAVSRTGGETDDSVCDVGQTEQRGRPPMEGYEFIETRCKNGQILIGGSIVPAGGFEPGIEALAKRYCRIADIHATRTQGEMVGIRVEYANVRCKIEKHKRQ